MKMHSLLALVVVGVLAPALHGKAPAVNPKFSNPTAITNKYLPLSELKVDILEGVEDGKPLRVQRSVQPGTKEFTIDGQKVQALIMEDREWVNGELEEVALDYFAQSDDGTVYYLGEDVDNYEKGKIVAHEGAWLYGKDTQHLGTIIAANPKVSEKFSAEVAPGITREDDIVESVNHTSSVPAGTFAGCIKIKETTSDGKTEYKDYAPGVGVVKEYGKDVDVTLRSHNK